MVEALRPLAGLLTGHRAAADEPGVFPWRQLHSLLTSQELTVAQLAAQGPSNRQIARELTLGVRTIEYHLGHVYAKLGLTSRLVRSLRSAPACDSQEAISIEPATGAGGASVGAWAVAAAQRRPARPPLRVDARVSASSSQAITRGSNARSASSSLEH
ncbi:response regulator transcription factor [Streptomyces sp. NPDC052013]|uniref:response regulator transcription factor n=1 Tax=Streptomyces sp. NPDC052013 TaxID=3365679 RepID=UPI0037D380EC